MASCVFHSDRAGVGVCMSCRKVICSTCCTRIDGINHCHACLKRIGSREEKGRSSTPIWPLVATAVGGLSWLMLVGILWLLQGSLAP